MKAIIAIIIVVGLSLLGWNGYNYYSKFEDKKTAEQAPAVVDVPIEQLPGLPPALEPRLQASVTSAKALKEFLSTYGQAIRDPRRAAIEMDYVVLVAHSDIAEARKMFAKVKERLGSNTNSPVYPRFKLLQKTYDQNLTP